MPRGTPCPRALAILTAAAARLGIAKTAVSTHMQRLEAEIGASLLIRTTRKLSLTEAGERFYESCRAIVRDAELAVQAAGQSATELSGTLRITAPVDYGASVVAPVATRLQLRHPGLRVELLSGDRLFDLVGEGIDVAIRLGRLVGHEGHGVGGMRNRVAGLCRTGGR